MAAEIVNIAGRAKPNLGDGLASDCQPPTEKMLPVQLQQWRRPRSEPGAEYVRVYDDVNRAVHSLIAARNSSHSDSERSSIAKS